MKILDSALRHGMTEDSIFHAWQNRTREVEFEYQGETRLLVIGGDNSGALLELVVVPVGTPVRIIHAMPLRPRFNDFLR